MSNIPCILKSIPQSKCSLRLQQRRLHLCLLGFNCPYYTKKRIPCKLSCYYIFSKHKLSNWILQLKQWNRCFYKIPFLHLSSFFLVLDIINFVLRVKFSSLFFWNVLIASTFMFCNLLCVTKNILFYVTYGCKYLRKFN